jgi:hypothetical protein
MNSHRIGSTVLLAGGIVLVFGGLSSALGFSASGVVASLAAIAALLYAGGVWFGATPRPDAAAVVFTRTLTLASGALAGRSIGDLFSETDRREIEARCRAALEGHPSRFTCGTGAAARSFEAAPVRGADGAVVYGLLLSGALASQARAELTPVA